eukprot:CCRYP_019272-RA/>CCRYP_019272-RA protein AED:0.25 eAED:0.25 QI:0/0/0/1/0.66/0.75/4/0/703
MSTIDANGQLFTDQTAASQSRPTVSRHRSELLKAYTEVYQFFRTRGFRPQLHRLDNETSKDVEHFITENNATFQYTPPDMHRTNVAERAIRTWKNHFVAIRAGTPLPTAPPTRVPNPPTLIPFDDDEYTPSNQPTPRYNLRSQSNIVLSAIAMIGEAQARGMTVAAVIDNDTGDSLEYRHLVKHPKYKEIWSRSYANKLGRLTEGIRDIPGTKTMQYIRKSDIPKDRLKSVAYSKIVVVERPQKKERERTRLTVVGTYIDYPGVTAVPTSDLTTAKLLFNSVISTDGATFHGGDLKNFYLNTPMDRPEYMRLKYDLIPQEIKDKYKLDTFNEDGWIYVKIVLGMQATTNANTLLAYGGTYGDQSPSVSSSTTLASKQSGLNMPSIYSKSSKNTTNAPWTGKANCSVVSNSIGTTRTEQYASPCPTMYETHSTNSRIQSPPAPTLSLQTAPITYGSTKQESFADETPPLSPEKIKFIQQVVGTFLFFGRAVDPTLAAALSSIASRQSKGTDATLEATSQLLDYVATHPNPSIQYLASDMILALDTDGSYLSELDGKSRAAAYMFLTKKDNPDFHNGAVLILSSIIKHVMASASETEIASLFYGCKEAIPLRVTLEEMGHPQPGPTPVTTDNSTAIGLTLNQMIPKASKSMDMRFQWLKCRRAQSLFRYLWAKGTKNRADYPSKHHSAKHHMQIRSRYVQDLLPI